MQCNGTERNGMQCNALYVCMHACMCACLFLLSFRLIKRVQELWVIHLLPGRMQWPSHWYPNLCALVACRAAGQPRRGMWNPSDMSSEGQRNRESRPELCHSAVIPGVFPSAVVMLALIKVICQFTLQWRSFSMCRPYCFGTGGLPTSRPCWNSHWCHMSVAICHVAMGLAACL